MTGAQTLPDNAHVILELLLVKYGPTCLPRELSVTTAPYVPPEANAKLELSYVWTVINQQQNTYLHSLLLEALITPI